MCDTFVALAPVTRTGSVLLAKNADTEVNEAQHLVKIAGRDWPGGAQVRLTHRVILQPRRTHEVVPKAAFVADCWWAADVLERRWLEKLTNRTYRIGHPAYADIWRQFNAAAALEVA
jgi:hypothetical protein